MIINCGKRRLVSYQYGWRIEIEKCHQTTGKKYWDEDPPAYPASLAQACEVLLERRLTDGPDLEPDDLSEALKRAVSEIRHWMMEARKAP